MGDVIFIIVITILFVSLGMLHYYLHTVEQVNLVVEMLTIFTSQFTSGEITESEYKDKRRRVFENFTRFQMFIFNKRYRR